MLNVLKKIRSRRRFHKWATVGEGFSVGPTASCTAEKSGLITVGDHCEILGTLISRCDGRITIGNHTEIRYDSIVGSSCSITIGSEVIISNRVTIYDNNNHPTSPAARRDMCRGGFYGEAWHWKHAEAKPIVIEDNVWIGEKATILKGVHVGRGAIVASSAVVTTDVPAFSIVAGNPAKVVKQIENDLDE